MPSSLRLMTLATALWESHLSYRMAANKAVILLIRKGFLIYLGVRPQREQ